MTPVELQVAGGATPPELAALTAALSAVLTESPEAADSLPAVYRSRWRQCATADAVTWHGNDGWGTSR